jgi:septal ring factor EnvC (AmiA/AmiB activator)
MKGISLLLTVLAVIAAGVSTALFFMVREKRGALQAELTELRRKVAQMEQRSADLKAERDTAVSRAAAVEAGIAETKARNTTLEARNAQLARENTQMREQLTTRESADKTASDQIADLRRQLVEAQAKSAITVGGVPPEQIASYEARITDLEAQIATLRRISGNPAGTASAEDLARVPADLSGNVIEVGPRSAFVVLDIGSRDGAAPSLEMVVRRGLTVVARVRLTDVRESYSIAHVLPRTGTGTVRSGDTATRS